MADRPQTTIMGWWSIRQNGQRVCGGFGSYDVCKREAAHYATLYEEDGPVKVIVRRAPTRKEPLNG